MPVGEQKKTTDEAIASLEAMVRAQPRDIDIHLKLAKQLWANAQATRASYHNQTAARLLAAAGRIGEAIEACQRALQQSPQDSEAALLLANLYARRPGGGHAKRIIEVVDTPAPAPDSEPLILLTPSDAIEELASEEVDDLSVELPQEEPEPLGEELDLLADLEEIDELEASRIESLDTTEREILKWEEFNTTQVSLADIARRRQRQLEAGAAPHASDQDLVPHAWMLSGDDAPTNPLGDPETSEHKPISLSELARRRKARLQPKTEPAPQPRTTPATPEALRAPETEPATPTALRSTDSQGEADDATPTTPERADRELNIAALDASEITTAEYGELGEDALASLEEVLSSAEDDAPDASQSSMRTLSPMLPFGDDLTPMPIDEAPPAVDDEIEAHGDEELELHQDEVEELETHEFQAITPQDVLEVIDASDDAFLRGRDSMVFSSGSSRVTALEAEAGAVPGATSHAEATPQTQKQDSFDAIADLIQDSLDASLDSIEEVTGEVTGEFHGISRADVALAQDPPVPGWSRQAKFTRPPEASSEPPLPVQADVSPWSPRALQEALGGEEESQDGPEGPGLSLRGVAQALIRRLEPAPSQRLARWLRRRRFAPGAIILREGVPHHSLFLIEEGAVFFERRVATGRQKVATMTAGEVFGEFELLLGRAPRAQVRAGQETVLLELTERALQDLSITANDLWPQLWRFYQERLVRSFLENSSLFTALSPQQRAELATSFQEQVRASGETLIRQGEPGTGMYLISSGEVMVSHQQQERRTVVANLREGNFFCSLAQSAREPISASVEVRDEARLMVLPREVLLAQLQEHHSIREALGRLVSYRQIVVGKTNYSRIGVPG